MAHLSQEEQPSQAPRPDSHSLEARHRERAVLKLR